MTTPYVVQDTAPKPSTVDRIAKIAAPALTVADWLQTMNIAGHPKTWKEHNLLLGDHPSQGKVNTYMGLATVASMLGPDVLPKKLRTPARLAWAGLELANVIRNRAIGIGMTIP